MKAILESLYLILDNFPFHYSIWHFSNSFSVNSFTNSTFNVLTLWVHLLMGKTFFMKNIWEKKTDGWLHLQQCRDHSQLGQRKGLHLLLALVEKLLVIFVFPDEYHQRAPLDPHGCSQLLPWWCVDVRLLKKKYLMITEITLYIKFYRFRHQIEHENL